MTKARARYFRRSGLGVAPALVAVWVGCAQPQPPPAKPAVVRPQAPAQLRDDAWGRFRSHRQGMSVPFPVGSEWRIDDHTSEWLDAKHPDTASRLRARVWHEPAVMSRHSCEAQQRKRTVDLPEVGADGVIDEFAIDRESSEPASDWHAVVGIRASQPEHHGLHGYVLSFGAAGRTCVAVIFETSVQGPKASDVLAGRLELGVRMVQGIVLRTRTRAGPLERPWRN